MSKFRFAAVDAEGMLRDGTIDAPDAATARARLEGNGLKVRELEEVAPPADAPPLFEGPPPTYTAPRDASAALGPAPRRPATPSAGSSKATYFLAVAGLLLTLFAIGYSFNRNPPWGRLSKYDFSNPEAALRSQLRMEANGDHRAMVEYRTKLMKRELREISDTLEINKTADFENKKLLFVRYKVADRETKREQEMKLVQWFEKDESSGYWVPAFEPPTNLREKDKKLAEEIAEWQRMGRD